MTIRRIEIENFQSHKKTVLELSTGVNVLVGRSDAGKTAVLRALKWVATNRPSGDAFRSHWGGDTTVKILLDNGTVIRRTRSNTKNEYAINGRVLKAMGTDVPQDVLDALNLSDVNWQLQHDPPFLLSESPGEVARQLNESVNLEIIDAVLTSSTTRIRQVTNDHAVAESQIAHLSQELQPFLGLPLWKKEYEALQEQDALVLRKGTQATEIAGLISEAEDSAATLKALQVVGAREEVALQGLVGYLDQVEFLRKKAADLLSVGRRGSDARAVVKRSSETIAYLEPRIPALEKQMKEVNALREKLCSLDTAISEVRRAQVDVTARSQRVISLETEWKMLAPEVCPLCGTPWGSK